MTTSREYRQFAHQCTEWAVETDTDEVRDAFLDLARDWTLAALVLDRAATEKATETYPRWRSYPSRQPIHPHRDC
jgi:hypothetical protein